MSKDQPPGTKGQSVVAGQGQGLDMERLIAGAASVVPIPDLGIPAPTIPSADPLAKVAHLEQVTKQLRDINDRVQKLVGDYEAVPGPAHDRYDDEMFRLVDVLGSDVERSSVGFDPQRVVDDSRGKVRVLIVDYDKLCMNREGVLQSLRQWFDENVARDAVLADEDKDVEQTPKGSGKEVESILAGAMKAKDKLSQLHAGVVGQLRDGGGRAAAGKGAADTAEHNEAIARALGEAAKAKDAAKESTAVAVAATERARQAELKCAAMQKVIDRQTQQLRDAQLKERSVGGIGGGGSDSESAEAVAEKAKERERELTVQIEALGKKLAATEQREKQFTTLWQNASKGQKETSQEAIAAKAATELETQKLKDRVKELEVTLKKVAAGSGGGGNIDSAGIGSALDFEAEMARRLAELSERQQKDLESVVAKLSSAMAGGDEKEFVRVARETFAMRLTALREEFEESTQRVVTEAEKERGAAGQRLAEQKRMLEAKAAEMQRAAHEQRKKEAEALAQELGRAESKGAERGMEEVKAILEDLQRQKFDSDDQLAEARRTIAKLEGDIAAGAAGKKQPQMKRSEDTVLVRQLREALDEERKSKSTAQAEAAALREALATREQKIAVLGKLEEGVTAAEETLERALADPVLSANAETIAALKKDVDEKMQLLQKEVATQLPEIEVEAAAEEEDEQGEVGTGGMAETRGQEGPPQEGPLEATTAAAGTGALASDSSGTFAAEEEKGAVAVSNASGTTKGPTDAALPTVAAATAGAARQQTSKTNLALEQVQARPSSSGRPVTPSKGIVVTLSAASPHDRKAASSARRSPSARRKDEVTSGGGEDGSDMESQYKAKLAEMAASNEELSKRIVVLEERIKNISTLALRLKAGESVGENEWGELDIVEIEARQKTAHFLELRRSNNELLRKLELASAEADALRDLNSALDAKKSHLESMVASMEWQLSMSKNAQQQQQQQQAVQGQAQPAAPPESAGVSATREREKLRRQIEGLTERLDEEAADAEQSKQRALSLQANEYETKIAAMKDAHEQAVAALSSRTAALTEAVKGKIQDGDLVRALTQEARYNLENMRLQLEQAMEATRAQARKEVESMRAAVDRQNGELKRFADNLLALAEREELKLASISEEEDILLHVDRTDREKVPQESPGTGVASIGEHVERLGKTIRGYESLLRRRQRTAEQLARERDLQVAKLLEDGASSKKELSNARERVLEQERLLHAARTDLAKKAYAHGMTLVDIQSRLDEQEVTSKHLLEQRNRQQRVVDECRVKMEAHDREVSSLRLRIVDQDALVADLRRRIEQQASNERRKHESPSQLSLHTKAAQSRATLEQSQPFSGIVGGSGVESVPLMTRSKFASSLRSIGSRPAEATESGRGQSLEVKAKTLFDVAKEKGAVSESVVNAYEAGDVEPVMKALYTVEDAVLDEEGRKRRDEAVKLFEEDRRVQTATPAYKTKKAAIEFMKLRERFRVQRIRERMAALEPSDAMAKHLAAMEERHAVSLQRWEMKKQKLVSQRRRQFILVLEACSAIVIRDVEEQQQAADVPATTAAAVDTTLAPDALYALPALAARGPGGKLLGGPGTLTKAAKKQQQQGTDELPCVEGKTVATTSPGDSMSQTPPAAMEASHGGKGGTRRAAATVATGYGGSYFARAIAQSLGGQVPDLVLRADAQPPSASAPSSQQPHPQIEEQPGKLPAIRVGSPMGSPTKHPAPSTPSLPKVASASSPEPPPSQTPQ